MSNIASVLLAATQAAKHSPREDERELAAKYEAGMRRLIAEVEGTDVMPHAVEKPSLNGAAAQARPASPHLKLNLST